MTGHGPSAAESYATTEPSRRPIASRSVLAAGESARKLGRMAGIPGPAHPTRRDLLSWLGKGVVLGLGSELLAACGREDGPVLPGGGGFPFEPAQRLSAPLDSWGERTVDPQDLAALLRTWRLRVDGLVESPQDLAFADLVSLPREDPVTDFHCVEGWSVYDVPWNGVSLGSLLDRARPLASAGYAAFHTVRNAYNESVPLAVALEPRTLLAYGVGGFTLPLAHGFPLRVVVPRLLGYKNAKYVYRVEVTDRPVNGFWVRAGYPYAGEVPARRLRPGKY